MAHQEISTLGEYIPDSMRRGNGYPSGTGRSLGDDKDTGTTQVTSIDRDHSGPPSSASSDAPIFDHNRDTAPRKTPRQKKRSTRACDVCRKSKVRCNASLPCKRCTDLDLTCEYLRVPQRRGRARRQPLQVPDAEPLEPFVVPTTSSGPNESRHVPSHSPSSSNIAAPELSTYLEDQNTLVSGQEPLNSWDMSSHQILSHGNLLESQGSPNWWREQAFANYPSDQYDFSPVGISPWTQLTAATMPAHPDQQILLDIPTSYSPDGNIATSRGILVESGDMDHDRESRKTRSPAPSNQARISVSATLKIASERELRYPVLWPLVEHINSIISISDACNLLDYYFTESTNSSVLFQPHSPYVLAHIFRKRTFLSSRYFRPTSAALLCSMLFVAIQTTSLADLNTTPSSKAAVSKNLLDLCLKLLGPLVPFEELDRQIFDMHNIEKYQDLDVVVTYIHLGTVISAGDFKGKAYVWWKSAVQLSLQLGLNKELEHVDPTDSPMWIEEIREERRRTWWLVYMCDRHIALSFNAPLMISQTAGDSVYLPIDEATWQGDGFAFSDGTPRQRGPSYKIVGMSLFGYFLPLMRILGEIINLHHERNKQTQDLGHELAMEPIVESITAMLEAFEGSLRHVSAFLGTQPNQLTQIVLCYSNHLFHVLYILLYGKWDLISMLDDTDFWVGSPRFTASVQHAVAAAETISQILVLDPGLNYMPYLWGIYLLHGSFLLVLFAEKVEPGSGGNEKVISACETALRGHEVCVATLNTEYQREFRRVLGWTLQKIRQNNSLDMAKRSDNIRRSLLLYRWCADGSGLAL